MTARKQRPFVIYWNGMELLAGWPIGISHQAIRAAAIGDAIDNASLMLVLISASSNSSRHVAREIERADRKQIPTVPLRIENVTPSESLGYFVAYVQWIDIFPGPIEAYWPKLSLAICQKLNQKIPEKKDRGDSEIPSERSSDIKTIVVITHRHFRRADRDEAPDFRAPLPGSPISESMCAWIALICSA